MPTYLVDATVFRAEGAVVNWSDVAARLGISSSDGSKLSATVQLRWMLKSSMGLPTGPFQVWRRNHSPQGIEKALKLTQIDSFAINATILSWSDGAMSNVSVDVESPIPGTVYAFASSPDMNHVCAHVDVPVGKSTVYLSAPVIDGLIASTNVVVKAVRGIAPEALSQAAGWTLVETVGLPVKQQDWNGIGQHGKPQGMTGALVDAQTAAIQRLGRAAPPIGWAPTLAGVNAPTWSAPSFVLLVSEMNQHLLPDLKSLVINWPPKDQWAHKIDVKLPSPVPGEQDATTSISPIVATLLSASADPFLSLCLGFGTGYKFGSATEAPRYDYMISAHWEKGLDGVSAPLDYAAIIMDPSTAVAPPPPANLKAETMGMLRPLVTDGDWRATVRLSWDRPAGLDLLTRACGSAAVRVSTDPVQAPVALLSPRASGGYRPHCIVESSEKDPDPAHVGMMDREIPVPAVTGKRQVSYGAAVQDPYGQWTPWSATSLALTEPPLSLVTITSAKLTPVLGSGACPTTLELEFLWNWRARAPRQIEFVAVMYAAASYGAPSPASVPPLGFARSLTDKSSSSILVDFKGDSPALQGATIKGLNEAGDKEVPFGPAQGSDSRRYRLTIPGLSLDFALSRYIGLAMWARGREKVLSKPPGAWPDHPMVVSAADPRPPIVKVDPVQLASLPDASGEAHVRLSWQKNNDALGYFIYESTELDVLRANNKPEPPLKASLQARVDAVRGLFPTTPRRVFTRRNAKLITDTSTDITLPRGSQCIHMFVVLAVSAGQVESTWPTGKDYALAVAVPHISRPAPPHIEVTSVIDQGMFKSQVRIETLPGPLPKRIDLHRVRVDDAAKTLDTMGPPVASITQTQGPWVVTPGADASYIKVVRGTDAPAGSWRRVWYRAVAWTDSNLAEGALAGRSEPSRAAWVVLPPATPPSLTPVVCGGAKDIVVEWTCDAPLRRTPLGPHTLSMRSSIPGVAGQDNPAYVAADLPLDALPQSQPPSGSGAWLVKAGGKGQNSIYRAIIRRANITDPIALAIRVTDPLGRAGENVKMFDPGPIDPDPDLKIISLKKTGSGVDSRLILELTSSSPLTTALSGPYQLKIVPTGLIAPTLSVALDQVSTNPPGAILPAVQRMPGGGPNFTYQATFNAPTVLKFVVRMTAPDGRFVEQSKDVV